MPNFSVEERRALSDEELDLATQSRQPQLAALSDEALSTLISRLRAARDKARGRGNRQAREARGKADPAGIQPASGNAGTVQKEKYLAAALRRATMERKRRQDAAQVADAAPQMTEAVPQQAEAVVAADAVLPPATPKKATVARKPATRSNAAARGVRAKAAAQATDRRGSGARKVAKTKPAEVLPTSEVAAAEPAPAPKPVAAPVTAPEPAAKADPNPTALVKDLTEKAARRAAKADKARSKADKAARQAEKLGDKKSRKVSKKAEEKARKADRKARKTVRQARKAAADLT